MGSFGQKFKIHNREIFTLPGTSDYEHLATILYGVREFMVFRQLSTMKMWIEEITGGHLEAIQDGELWEALYQFCNEHNITKITR